MNTKETFLNLKSQLETSSNFISLKTKNIQAREWGKQDESHFAVLMLHGLGAHSAWFEAMTKELQDQHIYCLAYDQIGFGLRNKDIFHSYKDWINDLIEITEEIRHSIPKELPLYILGNSMACLVIINAAKHLQKSCNGFILCSPGFEGHSETFSLAYRTGALFSALLNPRREIALPYGFELITNSSYVQSWLVQDSLKKMSISGHMLLELLKLSIRTRIQILQGIELAIPLIMFTAGQERIVDNIVNTQFFAQVKNLNKKHIHLEEAYHDLMFDPLLKQVALEIISWAKK